MSQSNTALTQFFLLNRHMQHHGYCTRTRNLQLHHPNQGSWFYSCECKNTN